ncbi:hypothetical protein [Modicisalibacter luteus]|uniref:Uncharacterized protein n=1 Tax=Modicisalibacter luteus TaxID=453962 RepID=A0ABV7LWJ5_9GAMM
MDIARPTAFRDLGPQIDFITDCPARVQHIIDTEQRQFSDADAGGVGQPEQHLITLGHTPGDAGNADQVAELPRSERCGLAAGVGHGNLSVRIGGESGAILRELPVGLPTSLPPATMRCSRKVGQRSGTIREAIMLH